MDNRFCAILRELDHLDRFVRAQWYVLRRRSRGMQRSGFEIGFGLSQRTLNFGIRMLLST